MAESVTAILKDLLPAEQIACVSSQSQNRKEDITAFRQGKKNDFNYNNNFRKGCDISPN